MLRGHEIHSNSFNIIKIHSLYAANEKEGNWEIFLSFHSDKNFVGWVELKEL